MFERVAFMRVCPPAPNAAPDSAPDRGPPARKKQKKDATAKQKTVPDKKEKLVKTYHVCVTKTKEINTWCQEMADKARAVFDDDTDYDVDFDVCEALRSPKEYKINMNLSPLELENLTLDGLGVIISALGEVGKAIYEYCLYMGWITVKELQGLYKEKKYEKGDKYDDWVRSWEFESEDCLRHYTWEKQ